MENPKPDYELPGAIDFTKVEKLVVADPRVRELARQAVDEVVTSGILLGVRDALIGSGERLQLSGLDPLVINDAIGDSDVRLTDFLAQLRQTLRERTSEEISEVYSRDLLD